jgi:hypothetical protein
LITDEELTALALAAEPDPPVPDDAVPLWDLIGADETLVSAWYMPSPTASHAAVGGWRRRIVVFLVAVFLVIEVAGLCSAYGVISIG